MHDPRLEPPNLKFLYYFSNPSGSVLESKLLNAPEGTPIGQVYHWLYYNQTKQQFQKLGFKSISAEEGREHRVFDQGQLWFDGSQATLTLDDASQDMTLAVNPVSSIPENLIAQVQQFLQQLID